jgi:secondary thiamine-phosphate synthase enzyme
MVVGETKGGAMACFQKKFQVRTASHNQVVDVTDQVRRIVAESGAQVGQCTVFTAHATAAMTVNENADPNIGTDFLNALRKVIIEHDGWLHDQVDDNAAAHIKSALVGPSVVIPVSGGELVLGTWQNIFLCDFDGPRTRQVIVSVLS